MCTPLNHLNQCADACTRSSGCRYFYFNPRSGTTKWVKPALLGSDDGCCGADNNDGGVGGCGKCLLLTNPSATNAGWTAASCACLSPVSCRD